MAQVDAAVLGAGGPTGQKCVEKLLQERKTVRAVVRSPDKYRNIFPVDENLTIVQGDVTDLGSLERAVKGAKAIIFAASTPTYFGSNAVDNTGVKITAQAAKASGAHVVLVSSALVDPKHRFRPLRLFLNKIRWNIMDAKFAGENALRASGVAYTIVRPVHLTDDRPGEFKLVATQRDMSDSGKVSRGDVAAVCIAALGNQRAQGVTMELSTDFRATPVPGDLQTIYNDLQPGVYQ